MHFCPIHTGFLLPGSFEPKKSVNAVQIKKKPESEEREDGDIQHLKHDAELVAGLNILDDIDHTVYAVVILVLFSHKL